MFRISRVVGAETKAQGLLISVPDAPEVLTDYEPFRGPVEAWSDRNLLCAQLVSIAGERHGALAILGPDPSLVGEFERGLIAQFAVQVSLMLTGNTQYQRVLDLTNRDGLTGLYNHRYLQARLRAELARAKRYGHALTIVFCDIDHFKWYNDKNGHPQGDALLVHVAEVFEKTSRDSDIVFRPKDATEIAARYGGEEFLLILPETDKAGGTIKAERIRELIASTPFPNREMQPFGFLSISVGIASYPEDGLEAQDIIKAADNALYRAKEQGRNRVCAAGLK
ncbi:MAG: GGDEF domain-containing protein [Deltaproteobacteria bacterium]|nr:GGDEF domain-containing protein [Deltaproteobacteria bacterium]